MRLNGDFAGFNSAVAALAMGIQLGHTGGRCQLNFTRAAIVIAQKNHVGFKERWWWRGQFLKA